MQHDNDLSKNIDQNKLSSDNEVFSNELEPSAEISDSKPNQESVEQSPSEKFEQLLSLIDPKTIAANEHPDEYQTILSQIAIEEQAISDLNEHINKAEKEHEDISNAIQSVRSEIRDLKDGLFNKDSLYRYTHGFKYKLLKSLGIPDVHLKNLKQQLDTLKFNEKQLYEQSRKLSSSSRKIKRELAQQTNNPQPLIENFYNSVSETPLTQEQKQDYLKLELLTQLDLDQYIRLWKRLSPHYLSHVTGQGVVESSRGLFGSANHTGRFQNGFKDMLFDNKIMRPQIQLPPYELTNLEPISVQHFLNNLEVLNQPTADEAKSYIRKILNWDASNTIEYVDRIAVHFASDQVLDEYYGAEKDNEVFVVLPTDVLASQRAFGFNGSQTLSEPPFERKWNDVLIFPPSLAEAGIPIDAGIVFLPKSTMVDKNTGSKHTGQELVSAQMYWEDFFANNPATQPAHVIYYDGAPDLAVRNFLSDNNILKPNQYGLRNFGDPIMPEEPNLEWNKQKIRYQDTERGAPPIESYDPRACPDYDQLMIVADAVIDKHYSKNHSKPDDSHIL